MANYSCLQCLSSVFFHIKSMLFATVFLSRHKNIGFLLVTLESIGTEAMLILLTSVSLVLGERPTLAIQF